MAKPNYSFEKRQRDLQKKQKKTEKLARKNEAKNDSTASATTEPELDVAPSPDSVAGSSTPG